MKVGLIALLIAAPGVVLAALLWWEVTLAVVVVTVGLTLAGQAAGRRDASY